MSESKKQDTPEGYVSKLSLDDLAYRLFVCLGADAGKLGPIKAVLHYHQLEAAEARAAKYQDDDSPQAERTFGVCKES